MTGTDDRDKKERHKLTFTFWLAVFILFFAGMAAGMIYLAIQLSHFRFIRKLSGERRFIGFLLGMIPIGILCAGSWYFIGMIDAILIIGHITVFWLAAQLIRRLIRRFTGKSCSVQTAGVISAAAAAFYLAAGWYLAHSVVPVYYVLKTPKDAGNIRIVMMADAHAGTLADSERFRKYTEEMSELEPDAVIIAGDFVDDDSTWEDIEGYCAALGDMKTKYGVYYVFGNHDKGYYGDRYRGYSTVEFVSEMEKNNVIVLEDETILIDDRFYIVGRRDKSMENGGSRQSISQLLEPLDRSKYIIVADHQPQDQDAEAEAGADLVLSGHTHAGQLLPVNYMGELTGVNDMTYGLRSRKTDAGRTDFIVTSGIADWAIHFKTGCRSEYTVIDVVSDTEGG